MFSPKINILYGLNGTGKTTLLEALFLLATGSSFRTSSLSDLIRTGAPFFYLEAQLEDSHGLLHAVQLGFDGKKKNLKIDGKETASFSPLLGLFPSVLYAPSDAELISGAPAERRRFLNLHLAQSDPLYVHHLSRFWRAMKQRNSLLKEKKQGLECWEHEMVSSASYLYEKRSTFLEKLSSPLLEWGSILSGKEDSHTVRFHPSIHPKAYGKQMEKNRRKEEEIGSTLTGPHRDDLSFWIGEKEARFFASEGQKKSLTAALKMAEWKALKEASSSTPFLGVDDLTHSLDQIRQDRFFQALLQCGQVCITTPTLPKSWESYSLLTL